MKKEKKVILGRGNLVRLSFQTPAIIRQIVINDKTYQLDVRPPLPVLYIKGRAHGICFSGDNVELWIDDKMYLLSCNLLHKIEFFRNFIYCGVIGPGHELLINGETYEMAFGGDYKAITVNNKTIKVRLGDRVPEFKILDPLPEDGKEFSFIPDNYVKRLCEDVDFRQTRIKAFDRACAFLPIHFRGTPGSMKKNSGSDATKIVLPSPELEVMKAMDYVNSQMQMQQMSSQMQMQQLMQMQMMAQHMAFGMSPVDSQQLPQMSNQPSTSSSSGIPSNVNINDLFSKLQQTGILDSVHALTKGPDK